MHTNNDLMAGATPPAIRYVRGHAGGVLMRCPSCHQSRYVSEFVVFVRQETQRCPSCHDRSAVMEPVRDHGEESSTTRLRLPRTSTLYGN